jgi:hypothetical protein
MIVADFLLRTLVIFCIGGHNAELAASEPYGRRCRPPPDDVVASRMWRAAVACPFAAQPVDNQAWNANFDGQQSIDPQPVERKPIIV